MTKDMDELDKKYYKISEVAEMVGIPSSTLRFWESQFTEIKPKRNTHGSRFYTPADIEKIRMVHFLVKEKGMKLEAAQQELRRNREGVATRHEAITRLRAIRQRLQTTLDAITLRAKRASH